MPSRNTTASSSASAKQNVAPATIAVPPAPVVGSPPVSTNAILATNSLSSSPAISSSTPSSSIKPSVGSPTVVNKPAISSTVSSSNSNTNNTLPKGSTVQTTVKSDLSCFEDIDLAGFDDEILADLGINSNNKKDLKRARSPNDLGAAGTPPATPGLATPAPATPVPATKASGVPAPKRQAIQPPSDFPWDKMIKNLLPKGGASELIDQINALQAHDVHTLALDDVPPTLSEIDLFEECSVGDLPALNCQVSRPSNTAFLCFEGESAYQRALDYLWPFGLINPIVADNPTDVYTAGYRVPLMIKNNHMTHPEAQIIAALQTLGIYTLAVERSDTVKHAFNVYCLGRANYIRLANQYYKSPDLLIAGLNGNKDTFARIALHAANSSDPSILELFLGCGINAPNESSILEHIRGIAKGAGFRGEDVIKFSFHRSKNAKNEGKPSNFGFVQVLGHGLARFLAAKDTQAKYAGYRIRERKEKDA